MSHWTVYWVMQADAIRELMFGAFMVSAFVTFAAAIIRIVVEIENSDKGREIVRRCLMWAIPPAVVFGFAAAMMPSTRTLCAMIAVPAIVNNEELNADAAEIYRLGMERLKEELEAETPAAE